MRINCFAALLLASGLLLTSCSSSSDKDNKNNVGDDDLTGGGGTIKLGQMMEFEGDAAPLADAPAPHTHGATTEYQLVIENKTKVKLEESMASTACIEGSSAKGPFVTLYRTATAKVTTDDQKFPGEAVDSSAFSADLDKGNYKVLVTFYATSESCGAMLSFSIQGVPPVGGDGGDGGDTDGSDGDGGDGGDTDGSDGDGGDTDGGSDDGIDPIALDSALIGAWSYSESDELFTLQHSLEVSTSAVLTQKFVVNDEVFLDEDLVIRMQAPATPPRFEMEVTTIRVDQSEEPSTVGDIYRCIYEVDAAVTPKTLKLNCAVDNDPYPTDWVDAVTFAQGGVVPPPPPPPGGDILTEALTGLSLDIPDNSTSGVSQSIYIADNVEIKDVTVSVNISHTYISDLLVTLVHPDGQQVILHDHAGGSDDNIVATYGTGGTAPAGDLADFVGKTSAGNWQLKMYDNYSGDAGVLHGVTLNVHY